MLEVAGSPAGRPIDVTVDSIAADSLGARRASTMALNAARQDHVYSVLVPDTEIIRARQMLWDHRGLAVEHGAATALAALASGGTGRGNDGSMAARWIEQRWRGDVLGCSQPTRVA
ncbi:pyridoxal-phosphate dependent enzyme [Streptomyces eurythermus]|uniref:pyridoxal-phosphate dependent enzyme n=1 Tax=Streptomyces eurythermus TaxID=42237 RepID=UPI0036C26E95